MHLLKGIPQFVALLDTLDVFLHYPIVVIAIIIRREPHGAKYATVLRSWGRNAHRFQLLP
ncbi:MAG: hypothetical protein ACHP8A_18795 [Terriglobales bacterium]